MWAIDRANDDRLQGRLWKARDRLQGAVRFGKYDKKLLENLGRIHWEMGDHPAAGAAWLLCDTSNENFDAALAAFEERCGYKPANMLQTLPQRFPVETYPKIVQERLQTLIDDATKDGFTYKPREAYTPPDPEPFVPTPTNIAKRMGWYLVGFAFAGATLGVWGWGVVSIFDAVF